MLEFGVPVRGSQSVLTSPLNSNHGSIDVDDALIWPDIPQGLVFAVVSDNGVTGPDEIIQISGRFTATNLGIASGGRGIGGTPVPATWPPGATLTMTNPAWMLSMLSSMYTGYLVRCGGVSSAALTSAGFGAGACQFGGGGSTIPSDAAEFAIDDTDMMNWPMANTILEFGEGDLIRMKALAIHYDGGNFNPKMYARPRGRIEFKIGSGGVVDNTSWFLVPISNMAVHGFTDTSAGVQGIWLMDFVKLT